MEFSANRLLKLSEYIVEMECARNNRMQKLLFRFEIRAHSQLSNLLFVQDGRSGGRNTCAIDQQQIEPLKRNMCGLLSRRILANDNRMFSKLFLVLS